MNKLLTLLFLLCASLSAFDSVEVSNPDIALHKYGYFKSDNNLTQHEALKYSNENRLSQLPQKAASFGFDSDTYWFAFDVSTTGKEHFILDVKNVVATSCELFVFENAKLIRHDISGYGVDPQKRPFDSLDIKFELEENKPNITYLVKISSKNPHYAAFEFGTKEGIDKAWRVLNFMTIGTFAICFIMIFYNLSLFFAVRDTTYLYYCFYIGSYFAFDISALGFLPFISPIFATVDLGIPIGVFLQTMYLGLTLFTIKFLRLEKNDPKLKKQLLYTLYIMLFATLLVPIGHGLEKIAIFSMAALAFFLLYAVGKTYVKGYKPALFYLIATGVAIICNMLFMNMNQGGGVPYNIWTFNLVSFGLIWDMVFLSFALAYRIKILQQEHDIAQRMVEARSRFAALGETIGSIAHQWRQPLNELSSINTHIDAQIRFNGGVDKEELQKSLKESDNVIKRLSSIIDTFYGFFEQKTVGGEFEPTSAIKDVIDFMGAQFEANDITVSFDDGAKCKLTGNREEFFQAILNILSNSKDALVENKTDKPKIIVNVYTAETKVTVTIEDNGGGIKYKDTNQIFEPYVSTKALHGMGLGLFITKTVIEKRMGGSITAENTKDGARFVIVFELDLF